MLDNYQLLYSWNFFPTSRSVLGYFEVVIWHLTMKLFPERPVIECLFLYPFASDPPSTARANLRPLYRLCRHQFSRPRTILCHLTSAGGRDHSNHSRTSIIQSWRPEKRANLTQNSDGFFAHALQAELWSIKHERSKTLKMGASLLKLSLTLNGVVWCHKHGKQLTTDSLNEDAQWLTRVASNIEDNLLQWWAILYINVISGCHLVNMCSYYAMVDLTVNLRYSNCLPKTYINIWKNKIKIKLVAYISWAELSLHVIFKNVVWSIETIEILFSLGPVRNVWK